MNRTNTGRWIQAENILVTYGSVVALDYFSTKIPEDIVGLLGPNGAGKTTFIRVLLGLVEPDAGSITIDGWDPRRDVTNVRDQIGYLPEHSCLIEHMNAVKLVSYMARLSGLRREDAIQRTHEVLDFVDLGEERYRDISSYSTGMKQRVKLAQAIVHDPPVLFLDEPTNGMDPEGRDEMLELIQKIGASGKSIIVCSHILHEVQKISNYVIILSNGRLVTEGYVADLLRGEEGKYRIIVRGGIGKLDTFVRKLTKNYQISSTQNEGKQMTIVVNGVTDSKEVFQLAKENNIQIRSFRKDTLILEDFFVEKLRDVYNGGS
ncbi:MAG: ABC transporter ATP-binding protein [Candidatus Korarchaeota archaeon]|nr:ABC transporter ATP-binding protein [Candidatus Korarchaeota archaeon]NIU84846.1 ATP-binding cassette domain-containing protein [Candidatus Thorarchaeota archaeon]NIW14864.1 ATP-binding cassette domain-containing protein [Candidatus Thorarchaeota archaeon]NIW52905.1 ATP-binding cassette domain-containing protein [Candidatus Korarchaeota archaeon]